MEPRSAMINAGCTALTSTPAASSGICRPGRPVGTWPMTGVSVSHRTLSSVPAISAARAEGRYALSRLGHRMPTARVTAAMATALRFMSGTTSRHARIAPIGPPDATSAPMKGIVCTSMIIRPIPDMKPEMTEYGV